MLKYPKFGRDVALALANILRTTEDDRTLLRYKCPKSACKLEFAIENDPKNNKGNNLVSTLQWRVLGLANGRSSSA